MTRRRREVLAGASTLLLAGCVGSPGGGEPTDDGDGDTGTTTGGAGITTDEPETTTADPTTPSLPSDLRRSEGALVVDFPAFSAGDPSVERESLVSFADGPTFEVVGADDGEAIPPDATDPAVEVSRTLSPTAEPRAFVAPTLREGGGFEFRIYATAAFRDIAEMQLIAGDGDLLSSESEVLARPAEFEEIADGVFRDTTSGSEVPGADDGAPLAVLVSDVSFEQLNDDGSGAGTPTGIVCQPRDSGRSQPDVPAVAFGFGYDGETITVTHEGGDTVEGRNLTVRLGGEPTGAQFEGSVSAGDRITVDASGYGSGDALRIVWQSPDGDASAVLAEYTLP